MLPFVGEFRHSLDNKGRLIIPSRYRQSFGEKIYLCKGFEPCLLIVTPEEIEKIENKVREDSLTNKAVRSFTRAFFSGMVDVGLRQPGADPDPGQFEGVCRNTGRSRGRRHRLLCRNLGPEGLGTK